VSGCIKAAAGEPSQTHPVFQVPEHRFDGDRSPLVTHAIRGTFRESSRHRLNVFVLPGFRRVMPSRDQPVGSLTAQRLLGAVASVCQDQPDLGAQQKQR
jgi:hypothetical protein